MSRCEGDYDFEFPLLPAAMCNRCGALVQDRTIHDGWHRQILTRKSLADSIDRSLAASRYGTEEDR